MYHYVACSACFSSSLSWREGFLVFYNALNSPHHKRDLCNYFYIEPALWWVFVCIGFCTEDTDRAKNFRSSNLTNFDHPILSLYGGYDLVKDYAQIFFIMKRFSTMMLQQF